MAKGAPAPGDTLLQTGGKLCSDGYTRLLAAVSTTLLFVHCLGTFPEVSLAQARKRTVEARELVAQGIDPKEQRNADRQAKKAATEHTFQNIATAWYELKKTR
ncbi:hypothetical protein PSCICE_50130 [Pseudomonas cichorii]|nr:hypothetical protein PSCICE_50130 [Pseudomonas cichorii]